MSVSALTPPKEREHVLQVENDLADLPTHQAALPAIAKVFRSPDDEIGSHLALPPVLELDRSFDELAVPAAVQRIDQYRIFLGDEVTAHLARARQFVIIGIEFLVQDQETMNLRIGESPLAHQFAIDLFDTFLNQP
jgi:hypothetical protein